jgi:pSer/pThr/pTyr-binding forkhead associated (FHA) protein
MGAYLEVWGGGRPQVVALEGARATIGRSGENAVVLRDGSASRVHALVEQLNGGWLLRDLGSRNGTFLNGERIVGDRVLRSGDELKVGDTKIIFRQQGAASDALERTHAAERPPELTRREKEILIALCQPSAGDVYWTPASVRSIGEKLHLSDAGVKQHLSRLYDKFELEEGGDRRARLANDALRRGAVTMADIQAPGHG